MGGSQSCVFAYIGGLTSGWLVRLVVGGDEDLRGVVAERLRCVQAEAPDMMPRLDAVNP